VPSYPIRALVLRKTKLGEADIIVTLLAHDGRIVSAIAKGMRKPTSRFSGRLEPGAVVDLVLNTGRTLEVVSDARSVDLHAVLRTEYDRSCAASVVLDVIDKLAIEGQTEVRVYGLACATLDALAAGDVMSQRAVVTAFLVKAMAMHGYRPHLESCVSCGCVASGACGFSLRDGGVVCHTCGGEAPGATRLSASAYDALCLLMRSTMSEIAATPPPSRAVSENLALMRGYISYHVPVRIKALDFFIGEAGP